MRTRCTAPYHGCLKGGSALGGWGVRMGETQKVGTEAYSVGTHILSRPYAQKGFYYMHVYTVNVINVVQLKRD